MAFQPSTGGREMILVDFFSEDCCKGTELMEGWYFYADDANMQVKMARGNTKMHPNWKFL